MQIKLEEHQLCYKSLIFDKVSQDQSNNQKLYSNKDLIDIMVYVL